MEYIQSSILSSAVPSAYGQHNSKSATNACRSHIVRKCVSSKRKLWKALCERPWYSSLQQKYRDCVHKHRRALSLYHTAAEECQIWNNNLEAFYRCVNWRITSSSGVGTVVGLPLLTTVSRPMPLIIILHQ